MINEKTKTPPTVKDELDEKLEKCRKWTTYVIASDGTKGFGVRIYESEEECQKDIDKKIYMSGNPITIGTVTGICTKPNKQGNILKYIEDGKTIRFPYPLLD